MFRGRSTSFVFLEVKKFNPCQSSFVRGRLQRKITPGSVWSPAHDSLRSTTDWFVTSSRRRSTRQPFWSHLTTDRSPKGQTPLDSGPRCAAQNLVKHSFKLQMRLSCQNPTQTELPIKFSLLRFTRFIYSELERRN